MTALQTSRPRSLSPASASPELDRIPPHDLSSEFAVIGCCVCDAGCIADIAAIIGPDAFYKESHQLIFRTVLHCFEKSSAFDIQILYSALKADGVLDEVGGYAYLAELAQSVGSSANSTVYADRVRRCWIRRRAIVASQQALKSLYDPGDDYEILDAIGAGVSAIAEKMQTGKPVHFSEIPDETLDDGLTTPWPYWNDIRLLVRKELTIIGARPSVGKTALACCILDHVACNLHIPCVLFSMEMSNALIRRRMISIRSEVSSNELFAQSLHSDGALRVQRALGELSAAPLFIDDTPGLSVLQLRAKARELKRRHGIGLIVIDYLGLMRLPPGERHDIRLGVAAASVKALAKELDVPVVLLCQLNRSQAKENRPPRISDLRDSGNIEETADVIALLHRQNIAADNEPETLSETAWVGFQKNRNGSQGNVKLQFVPQCTRFDSYSAGV